MSGLFCITCRLIYLSRAGLILIWKCRRSETDRAQNAYRRPKRVKRKLFFDSLTTL